MPLGRLGVAVIAAAVGVLAVSPGTTLHAPNGPAGGGVFASGTANGRVWRLAAVNLADPGYRCLPVCRSKIGFWSETCVFPEVRRLAGTR